MAEKIENIFKNLKKCTYLLSNNDVENNIDIGFLIKNINDSELQMIFDFINSEIEKDKLNYNKIIKEFELCNVFIAPTYQEKIALFYCLVQEEISNRKK